MRRRRLRHSGTLSVSRTYLHLLLFDLFPRHSLCLKLFGNWFQISGVFLRFREKKRREREQKKVRRLSTEIPRRLYGARRDFPYGSVAVASVVRGACSYTFNDGLCFLSPMELRPFLISEAVGLSSGVVTPVVTTIGVRSSADVIGTLCTNGTTSLWREF